MNKKIGFVLAGLWISVQALAQETTTPIPPATAISTSQAAEKIKGDVYGGYCTRIYGDFEDVHDAFIKYLKAYGKVKESKHGIAVNNPSINGTMYQEKTLSALAKKEYSQTYLWVGVKTEEWDKSGFDLINSQMDQMLKNFVLSYYRGHAQKKIDETQSAWTSIEKLQSKTVKQEADLNKKLENNVKEKARLEQSLIDNGNDNISLKARLVSNKKAQDSIANVLQQVKKKMAIHQEELRKIN